MQSKVIGRDLWIGNTVPACAARVEAGGDPIAASKLNWTIWEGKPTETTHFQKGEISLLLVSYIWRC